MNLQTMISYWRRLKENPKRLLRLFSSPCARGMFFHAFWEMNSYQFINNLIPTKEKTYRELLSEIRSDQLFYNNLKKKHLKVRGRPLPQPQSWAELVYILIRLHRPKVVVETGVFDGVGSSFILNALDKNKFGYLFSVDVPARKNIQGSTNLMPFETLPPNKNPGWLVPPRLTKRWKLFLIKKKRGLADLLPQIKSIDIFLHDSLHTKEHMLWEIKTVWPQIKKGGFLLVDDIFCNSAFKDFCQDIQKQPVIKFGLGVICK